MLSENSIKLWEIVGRGKKYQIYLLMINFLAAGLYGSSGVTIALIAPEVKMYWDWESSKSNKTVYVSTNCRMAEILEYNRTSASSTSSSKLIYESPYSKRTITENLNLVCERSWLVSLSNSMFLLGCVFGSIAIGRLSERYGRKTCTIWVTLICLLSSICILFSKGYIMFILAVFVFGASGPNICIFIFIQVLEIIPNTWSQYFGTLTKSGFLFGQMLFVGIAWLLDDWFYTQIFQTVHAGLLVFLVMYALESPMWLAVRKRYKEAKSTILKIVDRNGIERPTVEEKIDTYLEQMKIRCEIEGKAEKGKLSDLFKNRVITFYTLAMCVTRISVYLIFYGLVMNAETFGSGLYMDLTISNAASFASIMIALLLLNKFSIRLQIIFCCICEGIICGLSPLIYEIPSARSIISVLGRCFIAQPMCVLMVYITEVYPTSVRGVATGFIVTIGGLVSALSPFTKELGKITAIYVPFILFGVLSFLSAAGLQKVLPETKGKELVHTVDELVARKRKKNTDTVYTISTRM